MRTDMAGAELGTHGVVLMVAVVLAGVVGDVRANLPVFDVATAFRVLLVPRDVPVGAVVYRVRATDSDYDYPLHFEVAGDGANSRASVLRVDNLPCSRNMSYCQANLVLARRLERGRVYDFALRVKDSRGDSTTINTVVRSSNASAPLDAVFPHRPAVIMVSEDTKPGTELEYVIARKNPNNNRHSVIEIWGSQLFKMTQKLSSPTETNGSIILDGELDYETQTMYRLQVYALDAFVAPGEDTRNVVPLQVAIVVEDVQDTPPEFVEAPPVTELRPDLQVGDEVVRVRAEDGDKGHPRALRYGLVSEGSPLTPFFTVDETTGIVRLAKPLASLTSIARVNQPLLLTIMAEEVRTGLDEPPAMANTVTIALLLGAAANTPPYFDHKSYVTRLAENSPQGTPLVFGDPFTTIVRDDDMGKLGVFSLELLNNNGTFEVSPAVGQQKVMFVIHVRNSAHLDYETTKSVVFQITARERTPNSSLSDTADVLVYLDDVNDNAPEFVQAEYRITLPENVTAGTTVTQVKAVDVDTGLFGEVRYTAILGAVNTSVSLDAETGLITIATNRHALDREVAQEYRLEVEARDEAGAGLRSTVPLNIHVLDVNDETPAFDREPFELILAPERTAFSSPAFVHATDRDAEQPNNVVRYEILSGNIGEHFQLNRETGEVTVVKQVPSRESVFTLNIRAYDLGVPLRWSHGVVRIYPPDTRARTIVFIVPGANPDVRTTEEMLSALTGGTVTVKDIRPYQDDTKPTATPRSQVTATVLYSGDAVVDVEDLQRRLKGKSIIVNEPGREQQRADSGSALMWILIVLGLLLLFALLLILFCCLCHGCPLHIGSSKRRKTSRVHSAENAHLLVRETIHGHDSKGVQAGWMGGLKEAWSAGTPSTVTAAVPTQAMPPPPIVVLQRETPVRSRPRSARSAASLGASEARAPAPAIVFTRRLQAASNTAAEQPGQLFVEDVDGTEYRVLDPSRFVLTTGPAASQSSVVSATERPATPPVPPSSPPASQPPPPQPPAVHHFLLVERNVADGGRDAGDHRRVHEQRGLEPSPVADVEYRESRARVRQPMFLREGDAEIMRMVTRDGSIGGERLELDSAPDSPERVAAAAAAAVGRPYAFGPEASYHGKDMIMRRFMEDQRTVQADHDAGGEPDTFLMAGLTELMQQRTRPQEDQHRDSLLQRFLQEESRRNALARRRILATLEVEHDTQSLPPGHATASMWTQTNVDMATQTEPEPHLLRPPRRRVRSDNDDSPSPSVTDAEDEAATTHRSGTGTAYGMRSYSKSRSERRSKKSRRVPKPPRRHIKTPILEENESPLEAAERRARTARSRVQNVQAEVKSSTPEQEADDSVEADSLEGAEHEASQKTPSENQLYERLSGSDHSAGDPKTVDSKTAASKTVDSKTVDSKTVDSKTAHSKTGDSESGVSKTGDAKTSVSKTVDSETGDSRTGDSETRGSKTGDSKDLNLTEHRVGESFSHTEVTVVGDANNNEVKDPDDELKDDLDDDHGASHLYVEDESVRDRQQDVSAEAEPEGGPPLAADPDHKSPSKRRGSSQLTTTAVNATSRVVHFGDKPKYVKGDTYMSWYKKKREEREKERKKRQDEDKASKTKKPQLSTADPQPRTNRATEARRALASGSLKSSEPAVRVIESVHVENRTMAPVSVNSHVGDGGRSSIFQETGRRVPPPVPPVVRVLNPQVSEEEAVRRINAGGPIHVTPTKFDDDVDSGIAMSSLFRGNSALPSLRKGRNAQLMEKKSIFTIAYDEMHTEKLRPDSTTPPN